MEPSRPVTDLLQQDRCSVALNQVHLQQHPLPSSREMQLQTIATKLLDNPCPSLHVIEFLKITSIPTDVARYLMLAASVRGLALSDEAWRRLLNHMQRPLAEQCLLQMANEGGHPFVIQRLLSILVSHYRTPNPRSLIQQLQTITGLSSVENAERTQLLVLRQRIETDLSIPPQATEVQKQFLFYAKKIVTMELANHPVPCRAMNVWLNMFLDTASSISQNDLSQDTLILPPLPEGSKTAIHEPLHMTLSCSFMQRGSILAALSERSIDSDEAAELMRPYSALYDAFRRGSWIPEDRYALGLKSTVLKIRSDWTSLTQLRVSQCRQWTRSVRLTIEAIDSGAIRQVFANLRSTNQIEFIENLAKKVIGRMVADAFTFGKPAKMVLALPPPQGAVFPQQYPSPYQVWLKVCPTIQDLPLITVATPSGSGTFKVVWKVARLLGEALPNHIPLPVYAYAKFRGLKIQSQQERLLYTSIAAAHGQNNIALAQELLTKVEKAKRERATIQTQIEEEVSFATEIGANAAVLMLIQRKASAPGSIKGIEMECWDTNLSRYLCQPLYLRDRLRIAHRVCSLIETLHSRKILHLDVKGTNFLCKIDQNQMRIRLADFGATKQNCYGQPYTHHICTFRPPETVETNGVQPVLGPPLDTWGLGVTVFEIICGGNNRNRIVNNKTGEPQKQVVVLQTIQEYEQQSGQPQVATVLRGLLDFSPQTRWSAQQAREALARIIN